MARTSEAAVRDIIDTTIASPVVVAFIETANLWVTDHLAGQDGVSESQLRQVEMFLAAHLITLRDPRLTELDIDDVRERYQRGRGHVTEYLRTASALDPTGTVRGYWITQENGPRVRVKAGTFPTT